MHYAIAIAVLASLGTIGLAAPQNDAGDNSRCGISLFIGSGNPTCNVNTSNQPGGHGQSADLTINGDCAASGSTYSEFSATVHSLFLHSPCLLSLRVDMLILGVSPRTLLSAPCRSRSAVEPNRAIRTIMVATAVLSCCKLISF